jgi:glycosyltransferase involved in cell wall biosynthesis
MRLLFFTTHFYPYRGGLENYVLELASRLAKKGVDIDILTFNTENNRTYEEYKGINIYRMPCREVLKGVYALPKKNKVYCEVIDKIEKNMYDYVVTQTRFFYSSYMGMKFAKKHKIRLIHVEHGNSFVKHTNKLVELAAFLYDMTIGKKIFRSAWKVIGISKACCGFAKKMGAKQVELIYNSVDTKKFRKVKTDLKKRLKIPESYNIITFVGRLIYAKGVQDLIKATENINNTKILIVGDGPYKDHLKKLAEKRKDIMFLGEKNEKEIIEILSITDIFVNPSYSEGLPTSVLEAGSVGVPIIATDVGGTREIVHDAVNGVFFDSGKADILAKKIKFLLFSAEERDRYARRMSVDVDKNFSWDKTVNHFLGVLKE